jgi:hypothetical protein
LKEEANTLCRVFVEVAVRLNTNISHELLEPSPGSAKRHHIEHIVFS